MADSYPDSQGSLGIHQSYLQHRPPNQLSERGDLLAERGDIYTARGTIPAADLTSSIDLLSPGDRALVQVMIARLLVAGDGPGAGENSPAELMLVADIPIPLLDLDAQDLASRTQEFSSVAARFSWAENYSMPRPRGRPGSSSAYDFETVGGVRSFFREVLAAEAPIHEDLLMVILARMIDPVEFSEKIRERALEALSEITVDGIRVRRGDLGFYRVPGATRSKVRVWHRGARFRPPRWIPPAELDYATRHLVAEGQPVSQADLVRMIRPLFAWSDGQDGVVEAIAESARRLVAGGQLEEDEFGRLRRSPTAETIIG